LSYDGIMLRPSQYPTLVHRVHLKKMESDKIECLEVIPALQPQLRLYRRLYLARIDIEEAKATAEELLTRRIPLPKRKPPNGLLMALTTALVVSYTRPFINSRGQSEIAEKTIPGILLRVFTAKERELHEELLNIRNKEVVHSDAEILEITIKLREDGDIGIFRSPRVPFDRTRLRAIHRMIGKLEKIIDQRCAELRTELPQNAWL